MDWLEENINTIILGDCCKILEQMKDSSIDLIVTDPPYLINYRSNHRKDKNHRFCKPIENDNNPKLVKIVIKECYRVLKQNSAMYIFLSFDKVDFFKKCIEDAGFTVKNMIVWVKNNWTAGDLEHAYGKQYELCFYVNKGSKKINGKRISDVWDARSIKGLKKVINKEQIHQNQKPLELIKMMIEKSSDVGDIVMDPFSGSGTTCLGAKELNRKFIGVEIDKVYHELSLKRMNGIDVNGQTSIFTDFEQEDL